MFVLKTILKGINSIFNPINVGFVIFIFLLRFMLFGFKNANKMLESVSQPCIIPILRIFGAKIGENCDIGTGLVVHNSNSYKNLIVGRNCHIGKNCFIDLRGKVEIKNNVVISMKCTFITHIDMIKSKLKDLYPSKTENISIGDNVYLGVDVCILKGVTIGKNSMIAAKSLVKSNIQPNTLSAGVPTKKLKSI
jgi:acetyltransferase-like isoleucine patch superfamily enzyme